MVKLILSRYKECEIGISLMIFFLLNNIEIIICATFVVLINNFKCWYNIIIKSLKFSIDVKQEMNKLIVMLFDYFSVVVDLRYPNCL